MQIRVWIELVCYVSNGDPFLDVLGIAFLHDLLAHAVGKPLHCVRALHGRDGDIVVMLKLNFHLQHTAHVQRHACELHLDNVQNGWLE